MYKKVTFFYKKKLLFFTKKVTFFCNYFFARPSRLLGQDYGFQPLLLPSRPLILLSAIYWKTIGGVMAVIKILSVDE